MVLLEIFSPTKHPFRHLKFASVCNLIQQKAKCEAVFCDT